MREVKKGFVNGVDFDFGGELAEGEHDSAAHVAIEGVVAAENMDVVFFEELFVEVVGCAHFDAECFDFVGTGNDTAVIIGEYGNGFAV